MKGVAASPVYDRVAEFRKQVRKWASKQMLQHVGVARTGNRKAEGGRDRINRDAGRRRAGGQPNTESRGEGGMDGGKGC